MITKELFVNTINKINEEREKIDQFNDALHKVCDGWPILMIGEGYLNALIDFLCAYFEDDGKETWIEWWLFDDVIKKVWETDEKTGKEIEYDLTTPEALYDFLIENKKEKGYINGN